MFVATAGHYIAMHIVNRQNLVLVLIKSFYKYETHCWNRMNS